MAQIKKGILGGFSGKVGTVVGAHWRGKDIIRSLPTPSKKPPTELQLMQRLKFSTVVQFLQPLGPILNQFFGSKHEVKTRQNLATSYTLINAVDVVNFKPSIRYDRVLITKGELLGFQNLTVSFSQHKEFDISYENNSNQGNALATDNVNFVSYCIDLNLFHIMGNVVTRNLYPISLHVPEMWQGTEIVVWLYLTNAEQTHASTSAYGGKFKYT